MRRRPEAYHARLFEHDAKAAATSDEDAQAAEGGTVSIHDIVAVKEGGLSAYLRYDGHERRGALVRILEPGLTAEALRHDEGIDRLAVDAPWTMQRLGQDRLDVRREVDGLSLERRLRIGGPRLAPWLEVEIDVVNRGPGAIEADLAIEWSICLSGGGGNPAAYYEVAADGGSGAAAVRSAHDGTGDLATADSLAFGNDHDGVRVDVTMDPAARVTWFPIETVSNSEGGFERVYQGSSLLARWPLGLAAGGSISVRQRFAIAEARDLAIEAVAG